MLKKHAITAGVLLLAASLFSMWRANCTPDCTFHTVVLGFPIFLRTPYAPGSNERPEFFVAALIINILWSLGASVSFWTVVDTLGRWKERRGQDPLM